MVGWPEVMIYGTEPTANRLVDINIDSVALAITIIYLVSALLVLGRNFLLLRKRMPASDVEPRKKSLKLGVGWILFGVAGILTTFNPLNIAIIPNSILFAAFILIFSGCAPLKDNKQSPCETLTDSV